MPTYRFTGPTVYRERKSNCPVCGKRVVRRRKFQHTVNPFNRDPDTGLPRTWDEVAERVRAEADAWVPDFCHEKCVDRDRLAAGTEGEK